MLSHSLTVVIVLRQTTTWRQVFVSFVQNYRVYPLYISIKVVLLSQRFLDLAQAIVQDGGGSIYHPERAYAGVLR